MGAVDLLLELAAHGVDLTADGDALLARPRERLTDALRDAIRARKTELLDVLCTASDAPSRRWLVRFEGFAGEMIFSVGLTRDEVHESLRGATALIPLLEPPHRQASEVEIAELTALVLRVLAVGSEDDRREAIAVGLADIDGALESLRALAAGVAPSTRTTGMDQTP